MFMIKNSIAPGGLKAASRQQMDTAQLCAAIRNMRRGAPPWVLNATIRTLAPVLQLRRLAAQPCHGIATSEPVGFDRFLEFLSGLEGKMFKAWLLQEGDNGFEHEITLAERGVSLDGNIHPTKGLEEGIKMIRSAAPLSLKEQACQVGINTGAVLLGEPGENSLGLEARPQPAGVSASSWGMESNQFIAGATEIDQFHRVVEPLLESPGFMSLQIAQPVLSALVREAHVFYDRVRRTFSCECVLESVSPELERNLFNSLFGSDTSR